MQIPLRDRDIQEWGDEELRSALTHAGLLLEDDDRRLDEQDPDFPSLSPFTRVILEQRLDAVCREVERRVALIAA